MNDVFRVGVTRDFVNERGELGMGDIGLDLLTLAEDVEWEFLAEDTRELRPDQVQGYDALLALLPRITAATLEGADRLAIIARWGVGYDSVDVEACTHRGILLTITPDGVRRPVAVAALAFLLALSHKMLIKDRLTRAGRWADKLEHMGTGLTGRTLGLVGLGNIGREVTFLAKPFGMRHMAYDPYVAPEQAAAAGVQLVSLEALLRAADFVCLTCALTPETHHLMNGRRLALMKPTAYLINVARGPVVDQVALTKALRQRRIQGAATDVYEQEPIGPNDPLLALDNTIVAPHAICWTDEFALGCGRSACQAILDVAGGRIPRFIVNRTALDHPRLQGILRQRAAG